jgi:hypothetical protein
VKNLFATFIFTLLCLRVTCFCPPVKGAGAHAKDTAPLKQIFIPAYPPVDSAAWPFIAPGQTFTTVITNTSAHSDNWYPCLNRAGMEQIAWGDSLLLAYLRAQITGLTDTQQIRLKLVQVVGTRIQKTDLFNHGQGIYNATDSDAFAKQNSLMGALTGAYQKQCSNYVTAAMVLLIRTGYFNYNDIRIVQLVNHIGCEFLYRNAWAFVDFDPAEPFFMITDSANNNGFASAFDISKNRNLVTANQQYYYVNDAGVKINLAPKHTIAAYPAGFDSVSTVSLPYQCPPVTVEGQITLPAGASLIAKYTAPYILDPGSFAATFGSAITDPEKLFPKLATILSIPIDSARYIMRHNKISLTNTTQNWQPDYRGQTPTLQIVLPPTTDTTWLQRDLNFAGYILASTIPVHLAQTTLPAGKTHQLWTTFGQGKPPDATGDEIHYLSGEGYLAPHPQHTDTISVSFNPRILNFGTGFNLGYKPTDMPAANIYLNNKLVATTPVNQTR